MSEKVEKENPKPSTIQTVPEKTLCILNTETAEHVRPSDLNKWIESSSQKVVSNHTPNDSPGNRPASGEQDQLHAKHETDQVSQPEKQPVTPLLQAAQVDHKSATPLVLPCALVGGNPQTPSGIKDSTPSTGQNRLKKTRKKKRGSHVSVRFQDDEADVLSRRMERTGESQSDALRNIVIESEEKAGGVTISPKAPPQHLEDLLGMLGDWRRAFSTAKPRLNIATPPTDDERYAEVRAWRSETERLLREIPLLETIAKAALGSVTNLTSADIEELRMGISTLEKWKNGFLERELNHPVQFTQVLINLVNSLGIEQEETK